PRPLRFLPSPTLFRSCSDRIGRARERRSAAQAEGSQSEFRWMSSPVDPTRSTTLADPEPLLTAQAGQALDREAFLKLLVAQLEYQDPLMPQDSKEFIAELAQL